MNLTRATLVGTLTVGVLSLSGCDPFGIFGGGDKPRGCTDSRALNYSTTAAVDDGSCEYSRVIFYKAVDGPPVQVSVDGQPIGVIEAFYPAGPGNCSAPGNATYQLQDSRRKDWNAQSGPYLASGTVQASRTECIRVRVF
jgi:hypothetical protein